MYRFKQFSKYENDKSKEIHTRHIVIKLLKTEEQILRAARERWRKQ